MHKSDSRIVLFGIVASLCFMGGIAKAASVAGIASILFPELAALSYGVFVRPPYGPWSITACILGSIMIIKVLRSPVAPAISACFLALALGETSWLYPASILIGTCLLAGLSMAYQGLFAASQLSTQPSAVDALAFFGIGVVSTILTMLVGVVTLRLSRVHVTPALSVGLLPQVMQHVDWHFPLAVGIGSALLTMSFLTFRQFSSVGQQVPG